MKLAVENAGGAENFENAGGAENAVLCNKEWASLGMCPSETAHEDHLGAFSCFG